MTNQEWNLLIRNCKEFDLYPLFINKIINFLKHYGFLFNKDKRYKPTVEDFKKKYDLKSIINWICNEIHDELVRINFKYKLLKNESDY